MRDHAQAVQDAREAVVQAAAVEVQAFDDYEQSLEKREYCDDVFDRWKMAHEAHRTAVRHLATLTATEGARDG